MLILDHSHGDSRPQKSGKFCPSGKDCTIRQLSHLHFIQVSKQLTHWLTGNRCISQTHQYSFHAALPLWPLSPPSPPIYQISPFGHLDSSQSNFNNYHMNDVIILHITVGQIYEIYYNYFLFQCCVNVVTVGMHFLLIIPIFLFSEWISEMKT